jgi:hypothetical protein
MKGERWKKKESKTQQTIIIDKNEKFQTSQAKEKSGKQKNEEEVKLRRTNIVELLQQRVLIAGGPEVVESHVV